MNALLSLEPRDAGADVPEPDLEFANGYHTEQDRTRCEGCCINASWAIIHTRSS
ncbi:hypothetical protein [Plantactinospora sp. ZYX-F-223]|uniref:hypothetical protein n=1 Tax=Plantactinospora sp. ZYX-F-223 TaxID=3144103 RepID=UPI0031FD9F85